MANNFFQSYDPRRLRSTMPAGSEVAQNIFNPGAISGSSGWGTVPSLAAAAPAAPAMAPAAAAGAGGQGGGPGWGTFALSQGVGLAGDIFSWLAGAGARRKAERRYNQDRSALKAEIGTDIFDPMGAANASIIGSRDAVTAYGDRLSRDVGFDQGQAKGALYATSVNKRMEAIIQGMMQNQEAKKRRDLMIKQALFEDSGRRIA